MEEWLNIVIRQLILYSLPVIISLTLVVFVESHVSKTKVPHPFFAMAWRGTWLPLLASLAWHRGIIIALPNSSGSSVKKAAIRCLTHALLCVAGILLFSWTLAHQAPTGLPPLHLWWAKILMFFNLCMLTLHLLPLPGLLMGEYLLHCRWGKHLQHHFAPQHSWIILTVLAASPLLDILLGRYIVYPIYESISNMARALYH